MIAIHDATPDDVPFLIALLSHPAVTPTIAFRDRTATDLHAELEDPDRGRSVFTVDDDPVGALAWRQWNTRSRIVELSEVAVHPDHRGKGIAAQGVVATCRHLIATRDAHRFQLETYGFNHTAQRTFERAGFTKEGVKRQAYWRNDAWQDGVLFGLLADELP